MSNHKVKIRKTVRITAMSSLCYRCEKDIEEEDDFAECDSCNSLFHLKCASVTKKEANARKNSKCLKLYCPECFKAKGEATPEKLKEILGLLYKMDMCMQQQKTSNVPSSIEQKLIELDKKISANKAVTSGNTANNDIPKPAYASIAKNGSVKPAIVIKPKTKQTSTKTFEEITGKIDKSDLNVCGTRSARDGGVVLRCENSAETLKAKQIVNEKLGSNYEVIVPKIKSPRIRITNIASDIPKESIINELKKHNEQIKNINMSLITVIQRKIRSTQTNDAVVEINSESYNKLMEIGVLKLPWRECRLFEHLHVKRCYKCCGFFHNSTECKQTQKCSQCAGSHKHSECKSKNHCCINCKHANDKYNLNLETDHHAYDKQCPVYKRRLGSVKNKIEYNDTE